MMRLVAAAAALLALAACVAHAATPPRVQLEAKLRAHDGAGARAAGATIVSIRCRPAPAALPHVYYCAETWRQNGATTCAEDAFHFLAGNVAPWRNAWNCGLKPPPLKPFPGDPPARPKS